MNDRPDIQVFPALTMLLMVVIFLHCQSPAPTVDFATLSEEEKRTVENALAGMEIAEGLQASVFAAEPTLINPTNIHLDERGRVWVIEALNYRNRFNPDNPYREEGDRILILEDTDGDGVSDKSNVFYQGVDINAALGIWVMGNKVIVSSSPNIFLFTDSDGDDQPDHKKVLYTNIKGWDHDHGAHAFVFGPDGRLYFNMGNEGIQLQTEESLTVVDINDKPVHTDGTHFRQGLAMRCEVDGSGVEVIGHNFRNNFELAVDSYGTVWQSDNDDDGNKGTRINYVMEYGNYGFTDEVTGAGWRTRRVGMHEEIPKRHWHLNDPGVVPNVLQTLSGSPTGILFYEGDLLPEVFHQQMVHCEPGHQVVRAYPTQKSGAGYSASIVNIMKGKDLWFRPSDVCAAPDGSIFVADWYDPGVGGHKMGDAERGRIYRLAPKVRKYEIPIFYLNSPENAVKALQNPNLSTRYLAWNRLHDWGEEAEQALSSLWKGNDQPMRARALWLLARIPGKIDHYLRQAIHDDNSDIRITGLRAARQLDKANMVSYLTILKNDPAPDVRREVAIALRHFDDEIAGGEIWSQLAQQYDGEDRWYLEALGIGADPHAESYFLKWHKDVGENWNDNRGRDIVWRMRARSALPLLINMIADPDLSEKDLQRFIRALHFHRGDYNEEIATLLNVEHPLKKKMAAYVLGQLDPDFLDRSPQTREAVNRLMPSIKGTPEWLMAVSKLQLPNQNGSLLKMFLTNEDPSLAVEAAQILLASEQGEQFMLQVLNQTDGIEYKHFIRRLGWVRSGQGPARILHTALKQSEHDPPSKRLIVECLGNSGHGQRLLYEMLETNGLDTGLITTAALKLMYCWDTEIRMGAAKYLGTQKESGSLPSLDQLLSARGAAVAGKKVFETYCANCHQVDGIGINFGPDLSEIGSKLARVAMYSSIIYPSAGINFGYEGFEIKMTGGEQFTGFIESETEDEVALRMIGGISKLINRSEIESIVEMNQSLMLENLHTVMSQDELVNLVEYMTTLQTPEDEEVLD
ncbi:MAG: PQQ-dependent sugar dehydrogenase [Saprospiraceae bacterium]|nr:PQQ-dependent sugar dehydrogenase [Saprospiraceae bacterium]